MRNNLARSIGLQLTTYGLFLSRVNGLHGKQGVYEEPVPPGGGHPARRGMGACHEAKLFEVRHDISNGRRRQVEAREF